MGERTGFLTDWLTDNQGFEYVREGKDTKLWVECISEELIW